MNCEECTDCSLMTFEDSFPIIIKESSRISRQKATHVRIFENCDVPDKHTHSQKQSNAMRNIHTHVKSNYEIHFRNGKLNKTLYFISESFAFLQNKRGAFKKFSLNKNYEFWNVFNVWTIQLLQACERMRGNWWNKGLSTEGEICSQRMQEYELWAVTFTKFAVRENLNGPSS